MWAAFGVAGVNVVIVMAGRAPSGRLWLKRQQRLHSALLLLLLRFTLLNVDSNGRKLGSRSVLSQSTVKAMGTVTLTMIWRFKKQKD